MKTYKRLFIICDCIFVLFLASFFTLSSLVQNGIVQNIEFSEPVQTVLSAVTFLPLILALFFLGLHFKGKRGNLQSVSVVLRTISILLLVYTVLSIIISFLK